MTDGLPTVTLPNVAAGPDPFTFQAFVAETGVDCLLVLLQRDYTNCRKQVRDRSDAFEARDEAR